MVKGNSVPVLGVEVGGGGLVGHVGLYLLGRFADRLGVGEGLSEGFGTVGVGVGHDRGSVLVHAMLMLSGGGEACTDIEYLRAQAGLFGPVASDSTLYRTMRSIDPEVWAGLAGAMATVRERVWDGLPKGGEVVLDIDSSLHEVHSEDKEGTAPTYKGGFGFHPIYCFSDRTGECLGVKLREGNAGANNVSDHKEVLDAAVEALPDRVGLGHRPGDDPRLVVHPVRVRTDSAGGVIIREAMSATQRRVQCRSPQNPATSQMFWARSPPMTRAGYRPWLQRRKTPTRRRRRRRRGGGSVAPM